MCQISETFKMKNLFEYSQSNGRAELAVKTVKRIIMDHILSYGSLDDCAAAAIIQYRNTPHSRHWGINPPPLKNTTPSFLPSPPVNQQTVQAPLFRQFPLYIGFLRPPPPPLKVGSFSEPQKY